MNYEANIDRYEEMPYRRAGRSGLQLPTLSLGLWQNFGSGGNKETQRAIVLRAFDLGITHFDLANNYGPPAGAAETFFGSILKTDLRQYRDEIAVTTKAGYLMWPGPYGEWGSAKHLRASVDQSLRRLNIDYVDMLYSHRADPGTPVEETAAALAMAVTQGKALYLGASNYSPEETVGIADALVARGASLTVYQPRYSMFDRSPEDGLFEVGNHIGAGAVVFSPLAQGLLTDRYLGGEVPGGSRANGNGFLRRSDITPEYLACARALRELAESRGQTLAQFALAWVVNNPAVTSAIIGASSVKQLESNVGALSSPKLDGQELRSVDDLLARYTISVS